MFVTSAKRKQIYLEILGRSLIEILGRSLVYIWGSNFVSIRSKYIDIDNSIATNNLFIQTARTTHYGLKLIKVQGPIIWNFISPVIRASNSKIC